jgi:hypothetical protein
MAVVEEAVAVLPVRADLVAAGPGLLVAAVMLQMAHQGLEVVVAVLVEHLQLAMPALEDLEQLS